MMSRSGLGRCARWLKLKSGHEQASKIHLRMTHPFSFFTSVSSLSATPVVPQIHDESYAMNVGLDTLHHMDTFHHHHEHDPTHREAVNNLLYDVPNHTSIPPSKRTLCALVANEPGVLSRVSGVLAGRGVNIDSLVVSETETAGLSRMTIVLKGGEDVEQARKQLEDLVQVWAVVEFSPYTPAVERELLLVKVSLRGTHVPVSSQQPVNIDGVAVNNPSLPWGYTNLAYPTATNEAWAVHRTRQAIVELTNLFQGHVLDLTPDHIMVELTAKQMKINAFIELIRPFGIKELARSGALTMLRSSVTGVQTRDIDTRATRAYTNTVVDEASLPPG